MNGLLIVNKPLNWTSRDVVNKLSFLLQTPKIGHTGTLDPIATGVLVCLIGKYTKLGQNITAYDKEYIAEIKLGIKTDTLDITGKILEKKDFMVSKKKIEQVFKNFQGTYDQQVPIYSAVKVNGQKLYEYARHNTEVNLPYRQVTIYSLDLIDFHDDIIKFKTRVSKGTYIRSLINDICISLNTVGTMQSLIRIKQGNFNLENSYTLEDVASGNYQLLNVKEFLNYPIIELNMNQYHQVNNGMMLENIFQIKDKVIFTYQKKDVAIYAVEGNYLKSFLKL